MQKNDLKRMLEQWPEDILIDSIRLNVYGEIVVETTTQEFYIYRDDTIVKFKRQFNSMTEGPVERPGHLFYSSPQSQLSHGRTAPGYLLASGTYVLLRTQFSLGHAVGVPRPLKPSRGLTTPTLHFRGKEMHGKYLPCTLHYFLLWNIASNSLMF